ncbi:hypothetical protein AMTR_s00023p00247350 [Amborella trichopoda]|uniref:Uncharacterized protein n=1 Tax=Amborella trichopoda TaxID=13333 RepID=W1NJ10_AMBTC|nr:hypothetical protein AMTR_s00023p00247350 [Amborella trichopoda]
MGNPSLGHAAKFSAQSNLGTPQPDQGQLDMGMIPNRPALDPSYQFYNPQPKETPPMAPVYPPPHQPTPLHLAGQPATLGSNPWVSSAQADMKYQSLEGKMKIMRDVL